MTNASILRRLLWKELRAGAGLWIALLAIAVAFTAAYYVRASHMRGADYVNRDVGAFFVALMFVALYAAGCGATIFSTERETGTFCLLQALPVSAGRVAWAKVLFAAAATAAMFVVLWTGVAMLIPDKLPWRTVGGITLFGAVTAAQGLAWGVFFSLRASRPMVAVLLAIAAASTCVNMLSVHYGNRTGGQFESYVASVPLSALIVLCVVVADVLSARRWFDEKPVSRRRWFHRRDRGEVAANKRAGEIPARPRPIGFGRLVWQSWRESRPALAALAVFAVVSLPPFFSLLYGCYGHDVGDRRGWDRLLSGDGHTFFLSALWLGFGTSLAGALVFGADWRRNQYRFLAQRSVGPRAVWFSRLLVWATPVAVALTAVLVFLYFLSAAAGHRLLTDLVSDVDGRAFDLVCRDHHYLFRTANLIVLPDWLGGVLIFAVLGFCVGQLCSMLVRSGFVAVVITMMVALGVMAWAGLMLYFGVPWLWSVAPGIPALLLASWVHAPEWLAERRDGRSRLRWASCLVVPGVAILAALPLYRAFSVPEVDPGFSVEAFLRPDTPEETATLELYKKAAAAMAPWDKVGPTIDENDSEYVRRRKNRERERAQAEASPKAVALALEASRREHCGRAVFPLRQSVVWSANLLVASGEFELNKGNLDGSLERYLGALCTASHLRRGLDAAWQGSTDNYECRALAGLRAWAAAPGQTHKRIRTAIEALDQIDRERPSRSDAIKAQYVEARAVIQGDATRASEDDLLRTRWVRAMPWERHRAMRVLNFTTNRQLRRWDAIDAAAKHGTASWPANTLDRDAPWAAPPLHNYIWPYNIVEMTWHEKSAEKHRRATRLALVIQAWTLEHGRRPNTFDELKGPLSKTIPPNDPTTGQPFRLAPSGLPELPSHDWW
ncbi:MAG: ABC transporter permease [Pirellulales bacterium]|nr:ABC transporter permease [Pirellulales bacterium]